MGRIAAICFRVVQGLLAAANLALSASVMNWYTRLSTPSPPAVAFLIFASSLSLISVVYLGFAPYARRRSFHHVISLIVETLNALFYFCGFIAYALYLTKLTYCDGAVCTIARSDAIVAATAFTVWIASVLLTAKESMRNREQKQMSMDDVSVRYRGERL